MQDDDSRLDITRAKCKSTISNSIFLIA